VRWETFLLLVLCATLILGTHVSRYFATSSNISIALASITPVAIVALPMTLVIVTGEIDISVGSIVGLCATSMAVCLEHKFSVELAMVVGLLVGTLAGLVNGLIIVGFGLPSLVVTIGTLALYRGQQLPGLVSIARLRNHRQRPSPLEQPTLSRLVRRIRDFLACDPLGARDLRDRQ
jgi:rhamnose transport system permease protein